jgi:hypothetical protein
VPARVPPPRANADAPANPQPYQVTPASHPGPASSATTETAGAQRSDFEAAHGLSSRDDRLPMVEPRTIPLPSATAQPVAKPVLATELRTGMNPTTQPISDANVAKSIRDRGRYARCGLPADTSVRVQATIYDGSAVTVTVVSTPPNAAQDQCIAQAVREISWVRELTVRNVDVAF